MQKIQKDSNRSTSERSIFVCALAIFLGILSIGVTLFSFAPFIQIQTLHTPGVSEMGLQSASWV